MNRRGECNAVRGNAAPTLRETRRCKPRLAKQGAADPGDGVSSRRVSQHLRRRRCGFGGFRLAVGAVRWQGAWMAWILHISDAHLGKPVRDQYLDASKRPLLRPRDRLTTQVVMRNTLDALARWDDVDVFDAVIFSGDITNFAREDGYERLGQLLDLLGPRRPPDESIVVVPGNHDVTWGTSPGSEGRYELFNRFVRSQPFVSPLLDEIDLKPDGSINASAPSPILEHPEFLIMAMNSSNWCGAVEAPDEDSVDWQKALRFTRPKLRRAATEELRKLRQHDVARISGEQLHGLERALETRGLRDAGDGRVRIAVLHHHLLPVSTREEIKTFESVTNLGEVRLWLTDRGFDVVVHGHKHEAALFWDHVHDPSETAARPERRMLVISAPGHFAPGELICRVLEILPRAPHERGIRPSASTAPMLRAHAITGRRRGEDVGAPAAELVALWRGTMEAVAPPFHYVYGRSVDEVYERLQSLFYEHGEQQLQDLLCVVQAPPAQGTVPAGYPPTGETDEESWFLSLVKWWQLKQSRVIGRSELLPFNHGERIYGWSGDAVLRAAQVLADDQSTTRSVIILVDPRREAGHSDVEYPAFVLVQLRLVNRAVEIVGYFRKQDVRHWWATNVAELIKLQREALRALREHGVRARQGRVVTFASSALVDEVLPALAVTGVDRMLDEDPNQLWRLAYAAAHPNLVPDRTEYLRRWQQLMADLDSPNERIATAGLQELAEHMALVAELRPTDAHAVAEPLKRLALEHRTLAGDLDEELRLEHCEQARLALEQLRTAIINRLGSDNV